jgi:hypothetical protein
MGLIPPNPENSVTWRLQKEVTRIPFKSYKTGWSKYQEINEGFQTITSTTSHCVPSLLQG